MNFPESFTPSHRAALEAACRPVVRISAVSGSPAPWESCFFGTPYLPADAVWPTAKSGAPLQFIAQLNFAEMPELAGFPRKGIVQFYVNSHENLLGLHLDDPLNGDFRVLFWPDPVQDVAALRSDAPPADGFAHSPGGKPCRLSFETGLDPINLDSSSFEKQFSEDFFSDLGDAEWDARDEYVELNPLGGHQVGGYPHFTQDDPRYDELAECDVLLFQMDSDAANGIQWGDMGVANFFVRPDDLAAGRFDRVLYNWDCH
jgi:uncharacterized protein YwqG